MKKAILFKTLVDILYMLHFIGVISILLTVSFGTVNFNKRFINMEDWNLLFWLILIVFLSAYIIFLRGLYFLRKMARFLLINNYFSENTISNLKKSGNYFLYAGILLFVLIVVLWLIKSFEGNVELIYDVNVLIPLFLSIIGMFFIIQSNALKLAKGLKEENDLTI